MVHPRHQRKSTRRSRWYDYVLHGVGELLITCGLVVALFLCWQLWWTGIEASRKANVVATDFQKTQVDSQLEIGRASCRERV